MSAEQWLKPIKYTNVDGMAFAHMDHYPEVVVRRRKTRWFGVDPGASVKLVTWVEDPTLFDVEIKTQTWCANEVTITGKKAGGCWLSFYRDGDWDNSLGDVYVRVYPLKPMKVNIYAVRDGSGQWSRTTLADARQMLGQMNEFLESQAAIHLDSHITDGFTIAPNAATLPVSSGDSTAEGEVWTALKEKAHQHDSSTAHLNLYLLKRWKARDICIGGVCEKNVVGTGQISKRHCVVEDQNDPWEFTTIVAHELMHSIGMTHNDARGEKALMYSTAMGGFMVYPEDVVEVRGEP